MGLITATVTFTPVPASLPSDLGTILAVLFMLIGVPMILFGLIFLYTGYVRYDAEQYLDELEGEQTTQSENRGQAENADADHEVEQKRSDRSPRADPADETEQRDR